MNEIILSIKPIFSDAIYSKRKTVELRRKIGVQFKNGQLIYIYTSSPVKHITGEAKILKIDMLPTNVIKEQYLTDACITSDKFDSYFLGCSHGFLIFLYEVVEYRKKIPLNKLALANFKPPQSFRYADKSLIDLIEAEKCT
ncbi:MAG: hypothetical protein ACXWVX_08415 [Sulfuricurvum sp.]